MAFDELTDGPGGGHGRWLRATLHRAARPATSAHAAMSAEVRLNLRVSSTILTSPSVSARYQRSASASGAAGSQSTSSATRVWSAASGGHDVARAGKPRGHAANQGPLKQTGAG